MGGSSFATATEASAPIHDQLKIPILDDDDEVDDDHPFWMKELQDSCSTLTFPSSSALSLTSCLSAESSNYFHAPLRSSSQQQRYMHDDEQWIFQNCSDDDDDDPDPDDMPQQQQEQPQLQPEDETTIPLRGLAFLHDNDDDDDDDDLDDDDESRGD
jgi:hypothetical protein